MTMSEQQISEGYAVDQHVRDDAAWVSPLLDGVDAETRRKIADHELTRRLRCFALTGTPGPSSQFGSLDAAQSDTDRGGEPGPHIDLGYEGVTVDDADQAGVVVGGEGGINQQQED